MADRSAVQLTVVLNPHLPLEKHLLEKLQALNKATRQPWLRSLLIEGLLLESRLLQRACECPQQIAGSGAHPDLKRRSMMHRASLGFTGNHLSASLTPTPHAATTTTLLNGDKPLAYLKRVIG